MIRRILARIRAVFVYPTPASIYVSDAALDSYARTTGRIR